MNTHSIGIDFGTTKTLVTHIPSHSNIPERVCLGDGHDYLPTTAYIDAEGALHFGDEADDMMSESTGRYLRGFKMQLGSPLPLHICSAAGGQRIFTARELVKEYLKHIRTQVEELVFLGEPVRSATITRPVRFSPAQCEELRQAAHEAGFAEVKFTTEPEAAGLAFCRLNAAHAFKHSALIIDWGGGTLDFALVTRKDDTICTHSTLTDGDTTMGGEKFDEKLWNHVECTLNKQGVKTLNHITQLPKVRRGKEQLTSKENIILRLSSRDGVCPPLPLSRADFNELIATDITKAVQMVHSLLLRIPAEYKPEMLLLVGGSSQIPLIKEKLEEVCKLPVHKWQFSREAVAIGAALWNTAPVEAGATAQLYSVELTHAGASPFGILRALPALIPGLDMVKAMELVENTPSTLLCDVEKEQAAALCAELRKLGATVTVNAAADSVPENIKEEAPAVTTIQPANEEKELNAQSCRLRMLSSGNNKIAVLRTLRDIYPQFGLAEAKKLVESAPVNLPAESRVNDSVAAGMLERAGARVQILSDKRKMDEKQNVTSTAEPRPQQTPQDLGSTYMHIVENAMADLQSKLTINSPVQLVEAGDEALKQQVNKYIQKYIGTCFYHVEKLSKKLTTLLLDNGYQETQEIIIALQMSRPIVESFCTPFIAANQDCIKYKYSELIGDFTKGELIGGVAGGILGIATLGIATPFVAYAGAKLGKAIENATKKENEVNIEATKEALTSTLNQAAPDVVARLKEYFMLVGSNPAQALANRLQLAVSNDHLAAARECLKLGVQNASIQQTMPHASSDSMKSLLQKYM